MRMHFRAPLLFAVFVIPLAGATALERAPLPDPALTPGAIETSDIGFICSHITKDRRRVSKGKKNRVFAAYGIEQADRSLYNVDHLVPLDIGGSNEERNLWPQLERDAKFKDQCERKVGGLICSNQLDITVAQAGFAKDWTAFCSALPE